MNDCQRASSHDQPTVRATCEGCNGTLNLGGIAHVHGAHLDRDGSRYGLNCRPEAKASADGWIAQNRCARDVWLDLLQQLQPFCTDAVFVWRKAGGVASRVGQTVDEAC